MNISKAAKLLSGPALFALIMAFSGMANPAVIKTLAAAAWLIAWWITEALPVGATSLLPLILFPALGILKLDATAKSYGDPVIFLFLGGFISAISLEKWKLHRRIALGIARITGTNANGIILGFLIATAFISMWISNTATTLMMLPIALSIVSLLESESPNSKGFKNFATALMAGIAAAANIGGVGTIIGTPPNVVSVGLMREIYGYEIPFFNWMLAGVPVVIVMIAFAYFVLTGIIFPNRLGRFSKGHDAIEAEYKALGKITYQEKATAIIFSIMVALWILRQQINGLIGSGVVNDTGVAVLGALLFFIIPAKNGNKDATILNWDDAKKLPWHILLLFGGGIAMATGIESAGIVSLIGDWVKSFDTAGVWLTIGLLCIIGVFLSEVMSNVALATIFVPVAMVIGVSLGEQPVMFAFPVALSTSLAFMLPMGTPPNAIVYGTGYIHVRDMVKAGFVLNIFGIIVTWLAVRYILPWAVNF